MILKISFLPRSLLSSYGYYILRVASFLWVRYIIALQFMVYELGVVAFPLLVSSFSLVWDRKDGMG